MEIHPAPEAELARRREGDEVVRKQKAKEEPALSLAPADFGRTPFAGQFVGQEVGVLADEEQGVGGDTGLFPDFTKGGGQGFFMVVNAALRELP
jgi:hypothetical protein